MSFKIRAATVDDVPLILRFIRELAEFERLSHEMVANAQTLKDSLFGPTKSNTEVIIGEYEGNPVAFALFFQNYSTFLGRSGIYLEDLYVIPAMRSKGCGLAMLKYIANLAVQRNCGRFEWAVLDWNEHAIRFYKKIGATPMDEWTVFRLTGDALKKLAET